MKMQDVILKLREEAPLLEKCAKNVDVAFDRAWRLFDDFRRAESKEGQRLLADAVCAALTEFAGEFRTLRCSVETLCTVNAEYKERLGPRRPAPEQPMLPGLEDEGGTSTTTGGTSTTTGGTSTTTGKTSSFMQSGRHG